MDFFKGKVIILPLARQVGKSALIKNLEIEKGKNLLWLDAENSDVQQLLAEPNSERLLQIAGQNEIIVIDKAHKLNHIESILKLYADYHKEKHVIASASSKEAK